MMSSVDDPCIWRGYAAALERLQVLEARARNPRDPLLRSCRAELEQVRRRLGNPTIPRLQYVAKRFPLPVLVAVVDAWSEATGLHGVRGAFNMTADEVVQMVAAAASRSNIPQVRAGHTPYDRYLPWVAAQLAPLHRAAIRAARRCAAWRLSQLYEGHPHTAFLAGVSRAKDLVDISMLATDENRDAYVAFSKPGRAGGPCAAWELAHFQYLNAAAKIRQEFRVITEWADATGTDLGTVDIDAATAAAGEWAKVQDAKSCDPVPQGTVVYRWQDGWTVQELTTYEQLRCESALLRHCVKDYYEEVKGGDVVIYSLRDPTGRPRVTMEWNPSRHVMVQVRAFANRAPTTELVLQLAQFREGCPLLNTPWTRAEPRIHAISDMMGYLATYVARLPDHQGKRRKVEVHVFTNRSWGRTRLAFSDEVYQEYVEDRDTEVMDVVDNVAESMVNAGLRPCDEDEDDDEADCIDEDEWAAMERQYLDEALVGWEEGWTPSISISGVSLRERELNDLAWRLWVDDMMDRDGSLLEDRTGSSVDDDELMGAVMDAPIVGVWMRVGSGPHGRLDPGEPAGPCKRRSGQRSTK